VTTASLERAAPRRAGFLDALSSPGILCAAFAVATLALHLACAGRYGYQRDELYFLACARHLAWGYVDQPPLVAVIAAISTALLGSSLEAIRLLPAVAAAATVVLTGTFARRFGAGPAGMALAMTCVLVSPFFLYVGNLLTMNAFEPLIWTAAAWLLVQILDGERPIAPRWFALGSVVAIGLLNKYTMGLLTAALFAGLLAVPQRRVLRSPAPYAAFALALIAVGPNLWWQYIHGWPQFELLARAAQFKNPSLSPPVFLLQQALMMNPATVPVWAAGLVFLYRARDGRYRALALAYALLFAAVAGLHGKIYYLAGIYPLLFAAGALPVETLISGRNRRIAYFAVLAAAGLVIAPQVLPILSLDHFLAYQRVLDFRRIPEEKHAAGRIPQQFADMAGWNELVGSIARAYAHIPADRRAQTAIWTRNYGMAGAVDTLGPAYGLPGAISGHNNYYLWGTRGYSGASVLAVGIPRATLEQEFATIEPAGVFTNPWVLPDENGVVLSYCRDPKMPLAAFWPRAKAYF
jgi:4-amino-4-deoxy-L-arabinose transferase-like glycosyltransferase